MSTQARTVDGPDPQLIFRRSLRPLAMVRELWGAREMVAALSEREFRARYKQARAGAAWAVATPLLMMIVFSLVLSRGGVVEAGDTPYPLFFYVALVPWTFFANSVSKGSQSIVLNLALVNKVYCPREVFPLASITTAVVDTLLALPVLGVLFALYTRGPTAETVWLPLLMLVELAFTIGVTLLLSALVVYLRDLRQVLPMIVQLGMFASFVHSDFTEVVPDGWHGVAAALNPLLPVIDGFRRAVLLGEAPRMGLVAIAGAASLVWLVVGFGLFKRMEAGFADIA